MSSKVGWRLRGAAVARVVCARTRSATTAPKRAVPLLAERSNAVACRKAPSEQRTREALSQTRTQRPRSAALDTRRASRLRSRPSQAALLPHHPPSGQRAGRGSNKVRLYRQKKQCTIARPARPPGRRAAFASSMRLKWSTLTVDADEDDSFVRRRGARRQPLPPVAEPVQQAGRKRVLFHLIAGAVAGATAKTVEAPLDRVKIIFQVSKSRFSFRAAARQMVAIASNEGIQGLWKGNGARLPRRTAASAPSARPWAGSWPCLGRPLDGRRRALALRQAR